MWRTYSPRQYWLTSSAQIEVENRPRLHLREYHHRMEGFHLEADSEYRMAQKGSWYSERAGLQFLLLP